jgi:hypothetical protein
MHYSPFYADLYNRLGPVLSFDTANILAVEHGTNAHDLRDEAGMPVEETVNPKTGVKVWTVKTVDLVQALGY